MIVDFIKKGGESITQYKTLKQGCFYWISGGDEPSIWFSVGNTPEKCIRIDNILSKESLDFINQSITNINEKIDEITKSSITDDDIEKIKEMISESNKLTWKVV